MAESILFVGDLSEYSGLIARALTGGYRVLCSTAPKVNLLTLDKENVILVIVGDTIACINSTEDEIIIELIESDIPVIFGKRDSAASFVDNILENGMRSLSRGSEAEEKKISYALECFLKGENEDNEYLIFNQMQDMVCLELQENGNIHITEDRVKNAIIFMEENYRDGLSLAQIAHSAYLSSSHFCRLFRSQTGFTCTKYLSFIRIREATKLLKETKIPVTDICSEVGFGSLTHFERVFKGLQGMSPSEYRQIC